MRQACCKRAQSGDDVSDLLPTASRKTRVRQGSEDVLAEPILRRAEGVDDLVLERDERDDAAEDEDGDDEGDCVRAWRVSDAHARRARGTQRGRTGRTDEQGRMDRE